MHEGQPCDNVTHLFCMRLAYKLAAIIEPCLRPEQLHDAITEFYKAIREDFQEFESRKHA